MNRLIHGGALDAAIAVHGGEMSDWLDLSTGVNPIGWPVPELPLEAWTRLPDTCAETRLLAVARRLYGVGKDLDIVAAPGTQALIELLPRILPGAGATILRPESGTYGEHAHCCRKAGRRLTIASEPADVARGETLVVLVHPNNPDGVCWDPHSIFGMAQDMADRGGHVIVDEAFCDPHPEASFVAGLARNMIVLRSFGKFFGLPGLRLGFAICSPQLAEKIGESLGPWAVSGPALSIGASALADRPWIEASRERLISQSNQMADLLERSGLTVAGRHPLFVLARHERASALAEALAARHILVRYFLAHDDLLRFGMPPDADGTARLADALGDFSAAK